MRAGSLLSCEGRSSAAGASQGRCPAHTYILRRGNPTPLRSRYSRQHLPRRLSSAAMAQQWWALDELGDLGELDALLNGAEGGCRAAPAAAKGPEGSSGAPLTPAEADGDACAGAPGVDAVTTSVPSTSGDGACETEPVGVDSAASPTAGQPGSPAPAHKLRCLDERHPATCARCGRVPHTPRRRRAAELRRRSASSPAPEPDAARARAPQLRAAAGGGRAAPVQADGRSPKEERCAWRARETCAQDRRSRRPPARACP